MSKPIDQEREAFEKWRLANFCGGHDRLKKCSNAPDVYYYTAEQEAWEVWKARAAVQPAGVVVPEGYVLVPVKPTPEMLDELTNGDKGKQAVLKLRWKMALASAPHPVSGEQTVDQHNAAYWQEQYELLRRDYQRSIDERAQDVAVLYELIDDVCEWFELSGLHEVKEYMLLKAAHRAQQGEQP